MKKKLTARALARALMNVRPPRIWTYQRHDRLVTKRRRKKITSTYGVGPQYRGWRGTGSSKPKPKPEMTKTQRRHQEKEEMYERIIDDAILKGLTDE